MAKLNVPVEFLDDYLDHVKTDYIMWFGDRVKLDTVRDMIDRFRATVGYEVGPKYIKVITGGSVHSFIVNKAGGKFPLGAVLKAASWKAPATNFARANLLDRNTWNGPVRWTGAL
jgi:hypothetical protein